MPVADGTLHAVLSARCRSGLTELTVTDASRISPAAVAAAAAGADSRLTTLRAAGSPARAPQLRPAAFR